VHTGFQLPADAYPMTCGSKIQRALHAFYFHPEDGLVVWLLHAACCLGLAGVSLVRLLDVARAGAGAALGRRDLDPVTL
jgi:hypothetical protein